MVFIHIIMQIIHVCSENYAHKTTAKYANVSAHIVKHSLVPCFLQAMIARKLCVKFNNNQHLKIYNNATYQIYHNNFESITLKL
jgi:hypothetical protein